MNNAGGAGGLNNALSTEGTWPTRITVIGYAMKRRRFVELHRAALRWPREAFDYVGIDPEPEPEGGQAEADGKGGEADVRRMAEEGEVSSFLIFSFCVFLACTFLSISSPFPFPFPVSGER